MLKFLLIILLLGYLFSRLINPLLRFLVRRQFQQFNGQQPHRQQNRQYKQKGGVNIHYDPTQQKRSSGQKRNKRHDDGEYVDYEEIE